MTTWRVEYAILEAANTKIQGVRHPFRAFEPQERSKNSRSSPTFKEINCCRVINQWTRFSPISLRREKLYTQSHRHGPLATANGYETPFVITMNGFLLGGE